MVAVEILSSFPSHESDLSGLIYSAVEVYPVHGIHRILDGIAKLMSPTVYAGCILARKFVSNALEQVDYVFNDPFNSAFQGGQLLGFQGDQPLGGQGDARNARFHIAKLNVVFRRTVLLARMRTTFRAMARTRRSSPSPNSQCRPTRVMTFKLPLSLGASVSSIEGHGV